MLHIGGQKLHNRVDGYFGIEQWEYLLVTGQMDYPVHFLDQMLPPVTEVLTAEEEEKRERKITLVFDTRLTTTDFC